MPTQHRSVSNIVIGLIEAHNRLFEHVKWIGGKKM